MSASLVGSEMCIRDRLSSRMVCLHLLCQLPKVRLFACGPIAGKWWGPSWMDSQLRWLVARPAALSRTHNESSLNRFAIL
eukprot:15159682-Alexandrium_andersonii.AAC.1